MAEFKNTVADARDTISIVQGLDAGVVVFRICCPSKRLKGGRSYEANLGIAREASARFLKAVDAHCRKGERGLVVLGPTEALSLSERAEDLLDAVHALDLGMKSTVTPVPDANPGAWELTRKLGRDGESADVQAAIYAATYAVAFPIDRWNSPDGSRPDGSKRRYRAGDVVHEEDLRRLRRAHAALELAADDIRVASSRAGRKPRTSRKLGLLTEIQEQSLTLYEELESYAAVGRVLNRSPKTVRQNVEAAKKKVNPSESVKPRRPRTQALPRQV